MGMERIRDQLVHWLIDDDENLEVPLCDFERVRYELRPCDVLLVEGRSRVSNVIRLITQSPWTHSCLYIGRLHDIDNVELRKKVMEHFDGEPDEQLVLEGMFGSGTIVSPLRLYKDSHVRICRPAGISRQDAQHVLAYCINKLGTEYDVRQILDLARFFFPWGFLPRRWRSSIFSHHPGSYTKTVCSTVIAEAFTHVSFPILPVIKENEEKKQMELVHRNPRLFTPRDFDYSPYFEIIKYPFIQVVEQGIYRQLPWNTEGIFSNDKSFVNPNHLPQQQPVTPLMPVPPVSENSSDNSVSAPLPDILDVNDSDSEEEEDLMDDAHPSLAMTVSQTSPHPEPNDTPEKDKGNPY